MPGKCLTYMQSGLPVLAGRHVGNGLPHFIGDERLGQVCESIEADRLPLLTDKLLDQVETDSGVSAPCTVLVEREFAVEITAK